MIRQLLKYQEKFNRSIQTYCENLPQKTRKRYVIIGFVVYVIVTGIVLMYNF